MLLTPTKIMVFGVEDQRKSEDSSANSDALN